MRHQSPCPGLLAWLVNNIKVLREQGSELGNPERSRVKPLWPPGGSTSGLNLWFLKRGESEIGIRTSNSEREGNRDPDHSANPLGLFELWFNYGGTIEKDLERKKKKG